MNLSRAVLCAIAGACLAAISHAADMTWTFAVQLSAAVNADPARIELSWTTDPFPVRSYTVSRKSPGDAAWGEGVTLGSDATGYVDDHVELGRAYEYQVVRNAVAYTAYGYIAVGINAPLVDQRGKVLLVVDQSVAGALDAELVRTEADLAGDGWTVVRLDVGREASPESVRTLIRREWEADREHTKAVWLFGHVPVPHAGNLNVDGHKARPMPADVFYGEMNGDWTDDNGDGVYDQSTLPSDVELMVGRVDFADLPGRFSPVAYPSEVELLRRYLDKDHAYRQAAVRPALRAIVGNAIGDAGGQAYAANGYRNFGPLVGPANVVTATTELTSGPDEKWISRLSTADYLWAYGCGAGSDFTVGGLGSHDQFSDLWASDFLERKARATFYLMFGSWFAEWDKSDNLLRTALAAPDYGLAASWAGRPHQFYHHLGVGEPIGYGIRLSQNNNGLYKNQVQRQLRGIHIALMGDPTLRLYAIAPPTEVTAAADDTGTTVRWKGSKDAVLGYHVYRSDSAHGPFTRLTDRVISDTRFMDSQRKGEPALYMVRAVALQAGPSGSFYNASQGAWASVGGAALTAAAPVVPEQVAASPSPVAASSPAGEVVWFDDALPAGASGFAENDRWNWQNADPAPFSGTAAHQSNAADGIHHHFFAFAQPGLAIDAGDTLFTYVYLDPARPPAEIMLTWLSGDWEHRAYWGDNVIADGTDGTGSRLRLGPLPPTGQWVRLEIPARAVKLENQTVTGMGFMLVNGRATWDRTGKVQ
jgi:hypothetical protein